MPQLPWSKNLQNAKADLMLSLVATWFTKREVRVYTTMCAQEDFESRVLGLEGPSVRFSGFDSKPSTLNPTPKSHILSPGLKVSSCETNASGLRLRVLGFPGISAMALLLYVYRSS